MAQEVGRRLEAQGRGSRVRSAVSRRCPRGEGVGACTSFAAACDDVLMTKRGHDSSPCHCLDPCVCCFRFRA